MIAVRDEALLFVSQTDTRTPGLVQFGLDFGPGSDLESLYVQPLRRVFSRVEYIDLGQDYLRLGVRAANESLLRHVEAVKPKYVLWHTKMYELLGTTLDAIRARGVIVLGWFSDDEVRFEDYTRLWIAHLDFCLTADTHALARYETAGASALLLMWGSNPSLFRPPASAPTHDVTFVGRRFGHRSDFVRELQERGISVETFGHGWPNGYLSTSRMAELYGTSRINLCLVQSYGSVSPPQVKGRIFDVCMSGGLLLCEYLPELEDYFEIGHEVVCFSTVDEAAERIRYLLSHEQERAAIALAGQRRAHADHTQEQRFSALFAELDRRIEAGARDRGPADAAPPPCNCRSRAARFHLAWAKYYVTSGAPAALWMDELEIAADYDAADPEVRRLISVCRLPTALRRATLLAYLRLTAARRKLAVRARVSSACRRLRAFARRDGDSA